MFCIQVKLHKSCKLIAIFLVDMARHGQACPKCAKITSFQYLNSAFFTIQRCKSFSIGLEQSDRKCVIQLIERKIYLTEGPFMLCLSYLMMLASNEWLIVIIVNRNGFLLETVLEIISFLLTMFPLNTSFRFSVKVLVRFD